jgi:hypothetical protein
MLLQAAPGQPAYRTGPIAAPAAPPSAYRTAPGQYQTTEEPAYSVSPEALMLRPKLRPTGVTIDNYDPRIEAYPDPDDRFYEATVLGGAAAAQGRQGPLDGGWRLSVAGGESLFDFQLSDVGDGQVEGAWRKVDQARRSGFVLVAREAGRLTLRFFEPGAAGPDLVVLEPALDGSWRGEMARGGETRAVVMRRR